MAALFPRWSNTLYGMGIAALIAGGTSTLAAPMLYVRTEYGDYKHVALEQPVAFDHRHHVRDDGIQCLYCHAKAASEANAGIPTTEVCMGCHAQIWPESELLAAVRESYFSGTPISWNKVHTLPDFVYFHHGVHVTHGIPCSRCHGQVENMARVSRAVPLTMEFCLDCHRDPPGPENHGHALTPLTTCTACHR